MYWYALSNQLTTSLERGHVRETVQGPTPDCVPWHCELVVASKCLDCCHKCFFLWTWLSHTLQSHLHSCIDHLRFTLLFAATPHPAIMQERGQVGVVTQWLTDDISQHRESGVAYSGFSSVWLQLYHLSAIPLMLYENLSMGFNSSIFPVSLNTLCKLGTKPTLPDLLKFTCTDGRVINIPVEIETKYVQFGTFLLDDRNGSRVKIMARKHHYDAEQINIEILQEWLTGRGKQPVTWSTLVEVLHDIELSTLAGNISATKCPSSKCSSEQWTAHTLVSFFWCLRESILVQIVSVCEFFSTLLCDL